MCDHSQNEESERLLARQATEFAIPPAMLQLNCCTEQEMVSPSIDSINRILASVSAVGKARYLQPIFGDCLRFGYGVNASQIYFPYTTPKDVRRLASLFDKGDITHWNASKRIGATDRNPMLLFMARVQRVTKELHSLEIQWDRTKVIAEGHGGVPHGFSKDEADRFVLMLDKITQ